MSTLTIYRNDLDRPGKPFRRTISVHLEMLTLTAGQDEAALYERGRAKLFAKLAEMDAYSDRWLDIGSHDIRRGALFTRITVSGNLQEHEKAAEEAPEPPKPGDTYNVTVQGPFGPYEATLPVSQPAASTPTIAVDQDLMASQPDAVVQAAAEKGARVDVGLDYLTRDALVTLHLDVDRLANAAHELGSVPADRHDQLTKRVGNTRVAIDDAREALDARLARIEDTLDARLGRIELALGIAPKVVPDKLINIGLVPAPEGSDPDTLVAGALYESGLRLFRLDDEELGDFLQRAILQTGA